MEEKLNDLEIDLCEILHLFMTLDNAVMYCTDSCVETYHLQTLSNYACKRLDKFLYDFQKVECEFCAANKKLV